MLTRRYAHINDYSQLDHCPQVTCCTRPCVSRKVESALQRRECERKSERKRGVKNLYHLRKRGVKDLYNQRPLSPDDLSPLSPDDLSPLSPLSPDIRRRWARAKRALGLCMRQGVWRVFDVARVSLAFCFCRDVLCVCQVGVCSRHVLAALFGRLHWGRRREIGGGLVVCWWNGGRRI